MAQQRSLDRSRDTARAERNVERLLLAYAILVPLLIVPRGGGKSFGASDVLFIFALLIMAAVKPVAMVGTRALLTLFVVVAAIGTCGLYYANEGSFAGVILLVRTIAIFAPLYLVARVSTASETFVRKIFTAFIWSGSTACLIGIAMQLAGIQVRANQQVNWYGDGYSTTLRAGGLLGNSSDFGHLSATLVVAAMLGGGMLRIRLRYVVLVIVIGGYATYLSDSRAAMLHILLAVILLLPLWLGRRRLPLLLLTVPLALVAGAALFNAVELGYKGTFVLRRFDVFNLTGQSTFFSVGSRTDFLHRSLDQMKDHPIIGIGYGATGGGDNSFLTIAAETGIVAASLYALFWLGLAWKAAHIVERRVKLAALALLLSEIAHMMTVDTQRMWSTTPVVILLIGVILRFGDSYVRGEGSKPQTALRRKGTADRPVGSGGRRPTCCR